MYNPRVVAGAAVPSLICALLASAAFAARANDPQVVDRQRGSGTPAMLSATPAYGWQATPLFTVGEALPEGGLRAARGASFYSPPGVLDGLGAFELDADTVRVLANHEFSHTLGSSYEVLGAAGPFSMQGARITFFDIDKTSRSVLRAGLAFDRIHDGDGNWVEDTSFLTVDGFSRFCSAGVHEPDLWGPERGFEGRVYLTGEETGGGGNPIGGAVWALDPSNGDLWHLPDLGRGTWENLTPVDTGSTSAVALILADDNAPFDADSPADGTREAAPLYLYVGQKALSGDFADTNGLRGGDLYAWVPDLATDTTPLEFRGTGATRSGAWLPLDNTPDLGMASSDGSTGFDPFGYPTQRNLWLQAEALGAFGFSRPEDVATNPADGTEIVLASTGVDTYAVGTDGNGADTFGTVYLVKTDFQDLTADVTILYDGDDDPARRLRSPDNLDWADDGFIYVQEDEAEEDSLTGEPLFGDGAVNPHEAGIVRIDPSTGSISRIAVIERDVVLDASIAPTSDAVDRAAGLAGEWESSGIVDVSVLFGEAPGTLFLADVQAHGIRRQEDFNPTSRIRNDDLVEGGQLVLLQAPSPAYVNLFADGFETGDTTGWE